MAMRLGMGPVFAYEWLARSRRWQDYATRAGFLLIVLATLSLVWASAGSAGSATNLSPAQVLAEAGRWFFQSLALTQLALVMLAAPAATAGAICLDRARGALAHALVTDLTDGEIVLGKLAARLVPVLGLAACALPVAALGTLLGGIDPVALTGAFLVCAAMAVLGCTLALALSNWLAKTHEVLTVVYAIWAVWLLAWPTFEAIFGWSPYELKASHPVWVMFAPYSLGGFTWREPVAFTAGCLLISALLAWAAVASLRPAYVRERGRVPRAVEPGRFARWSRCALPWWTGPSLDRNPVSWREWHRVRPGWATRVTWWLYLAICSLASLGVIAEALKYRGVWGALGIWGFGSAAATNAIQVTFGLLLLSVSAATALAEERVRGSLDLLLATPLSTRSIVWGKWWGVYRRVPWLAFWPCLVGVSVAWNQGAGLPPFAWGGEPAPQAIHALYLVPAMILVQGAAITSLGLALATWVPRLGRAVGGTIAAFVFMTVAWPFVGIPLCGDDQGSILVWIQGSPFYGAFIPTLLLEHYGSQPNANNIDMLAGGVVWLIVYALIAGGLLLLTLATFNECLGRADEVPRPGWLRGWGWRIRGAGGRRGSDGGNFGLRPR